MAAFLAFFLAFAIKVPMWPFHTWLPDAHVEAPTAGSVILAGVLLKLGGYGFIRFALPLFPDAAQTFAPFIVVLSLIAIVYGAIVSIVQPDLKKLVAYSSVSHMGFVTLGIFVFQQQAMDGAILQMVNHGLITGALFLCVGVIYERTHDRTIARMGGLAAKTPAYAAIFGFFMLASVGLPGLAGFVGEFLVFVGTFAVSPLAAAIAALVMVLGAVYLLWMFQRVAFGPMSDFLRNLGHHLSDLSPDRGPDAGAAGRPDPHLRPLPGPPARPHPGSRRQHHRRPRCRRRGRPAALALMAMEMTGLLALAPLITVIATAILVVIVDMIRPGDDRLAGAAGVLGLLAALIVGRGRRHATPTPSSAGPTSETR